MIFTSEIIIKKNSLLTVFPIITLLFILPLLEGIILLPYILIANFLVENLIFCFVMGRGIIAMFLIGLSNLISIILFGMKVSVINDIGITYCKWKVKPIYNRIILKI